MTRRQGQRWVVALLAVIVAALAGLAGLLATRSEASPTGDVAECQQAVASWIAEHPRFYAQAGSPTVSCVWSPGEGSGGYNHAANHVDIKPWGRIHWGVDVATFYPQVLRHEVGHAWAATHINLDARLEEYAAIRGVTSEQALEDFVFVLARSLGEPGRWWDCNAQLAEHGNCGTEPTQRQLAELRAAGFLP